jgi:hypothetical protein
MIALENRVKSLKDKVKKGKANKKEIETLLDIFDLRSETVVYIQRVLENMNVHIEKTLDERG